MCEHFGISDIPEAQTSEVPEKTLFVLFGENIRIVLLVLHLEYER